MDVRVGANGGANGAELAAILSAGIGTLAMGLFVLANEAGIFAAPSLYGPAGGVSGRTTLAVIVWLAAWGLLHRAWRSRRMESGTIWGVTLALTAVATIYPAWRASRTMPAEALRHE